MFQDSSIITQQIRDTLTQYCNTNPPGTAGFVLNNLHTEVITNIETYLTEITDIDEDFIVAVSSQVKNLQVQDLQIYNRQTSSEKIWNNFKDYLRGGIIIPIRTYPTYPFYQIDIDTNPVITAVRRDNLENLFFEKFKATILLIGERYLVNDSFSLERETLDNENKLIDQRLTVFLTVQTLLFGALAFLYDKEGNIPIELKHSLVGLGIGFSVFTFYSNFLSYLSSSSLEERIPGTLRKRIGFFMSIIRNYPANGNWQRKLFFRILYFPGKILLPPTSFPVLLCLAWVYIGLTLNHPSINASFACKSTIGEVVNDLKSKEVRTINMVEIKVPQYYKNPPTQRKQMLELTLSSLDKKGKNFSEKSKSAIDYLKKKPDIMKIFADKIVSKCDNYAAISVISVDDSAKWVEEYALQTNGRTSQRKAVEKDYNNLRWNERRKL